MNCCRAQETQTGALYQPRGVGWGGRWEGGSEREGIYVYLWLIHSRFNRKQKNSVKQLSFNKKIDLKKFCEKNIHVLILRPRITQDTDLSPLDMAPDIQGKSLLSVFGTIIGSLNRQKE